MPTPDTHSHPSAAPVITGTYLGGLRTELTHGPSGTHLTTAAPVDNNGDGSSFSPTDMVAGALGACMLTILGILAQRHEIDLGGSHFQVEKHMTDGPRRIGSLHVDLHLPNHLSPKHRLIFERAALHCPVHRSLGEGVDMPVQFIYDVETAS